MGAQMNRSCVALLLITVAALVRTAATQPLIVDLTPERVGEALALAADEAAARKMLEAYTVQTRAGWGKGPLLGGFSTPFSRVVQAALAARKNGRTLTAADISSDLLAPELHVVALSQRSANLEEMARVRTVALAERGTLNAAGARIEPARIVELNTEYQTKYGTTFQGSGLVAIFPLRSVPPQAQIRIIYDRLVQGSSPSATCQECVVGLDLSKIR